MIQKLFFALIILGILGCAAVDMSQPIKHKSTNCGTTCLAMRNTHG